MKLVLFVNNDNIAQLTSLIDETTGSYVNAATVAVTIIDQQKTIVAGPIAMTYISQTNGNYEGVIPAATSLTVGLGYRAKIDVTTGSAVAQWYMPVVVQYREN